jgi:hypothetical protein
MKVTNPQTLASVIHELGGEVIPNADTFEFFLPLSEVKTVVGKLHELGAGVRKLSEFVGDHPRKLNSPISIARLQLYHRGED